MSVSLNLEVLDPKLNHPAWLHGHSAFTSIRLHWGAAQFWPQHHQRLAQTCQLLGLPTPPTTLQLVSDIQSRLEQTEYALLRLTITSVGAFVSWRSLERSSTASSLGAEVMLSGQQVHPQWAEHKTGNYLPYTLALRQAQQLGAFEGLLTDAAGNIVDGSRSGLLLRIGGAWVVPKGGLPSITRAAYLAELKADYAVKLLSTEDLQHAQAIWLCGSGVGVRPVGRITAAAWTQDYALEPAQTEHVGLVAL